MLFELILGAAFVVLFLGFSAWHTQGAGKLARAEIDQYMGKIENLPLPEKKFMALMAGLRPWAEADDGKPFTCSISSTSSPSYARSPAPRRSREPPRRLTRRLSEEPHTALAE